MNTKKFLSAKRAKTHRARVWRTLKPHYPVVSPMVYCMQFPNFGVNVHGRYLARDSLSLSSRDDLRIHWHLIKARKHRYHRAGTCVVSRTLPECRHRGITASWTWLPCDPGKWQEGLCLQSKWSWCVRHGLEDVQERVCLYKVRLHLFVSSLLVVLSFLPTARTTAQTRQPSIANTRPSHLEM